MTFQQSSAQIHGASHGASASGPGIDLSLNHMMAMRQTALFQLIHFNRQNEIIAAATIAIQNRDDVTHPRLPELEEGHPGRVRLYLSIGVSLPPNMGKFLLKQTSRVKTS